MQHNGHSLHMCIYAHDTLLSLAAFRMPQEHPLLTLLSISCTCTPQEGSGRALPIQMPTTRTERHAAADATQTAMFAPATAFILLGDFLGVLAISGLPFVPAKASMSTPGLSL